jgi:hypothetical protein
MNNVKSSTAVLLYVASEGGHRGSYMALLAKLLNGARANGLWQMLCATRPVLFLTIEGAFLSYCFIALLRALNGRRTLGLLLRPGPALNGRSLRLKVKRHILFLLRRLPQVQTFTILPFSVEPSFNMIADGWIYDPQLWDLTPAEREQTERAKGVLCEEIYKIAGGRRICCAFGYQNKGKGFEWFAGLYTKQLALRDALLFAFGGKVSDEVAAYLPIFKQAGGYACNRFLTDAELLDLYAVTDLVWCAYEPNYDQASGIFGRAVQLGIPVVVRRGSFIHRLCEIEGFSHLAIDAESDWCSFAVSTPREGSDKTAERASRMSQESLNRLRIALGVEL